MFSIYYVDTKSYFNQTSFDLGNALNLATRKNAKLEKLYISKKVNPITHPSKYYIRYEKYGDWKIKCNHGHRFFFVLSL